MSVSGWAALLAGHWLVELWVGEHTPKGRWMYVLSGLALFFNAYARWPIAFAHALVKLKPLNRTALIETVAKLTLTVALFPYINIAAPIVAIVLIHSMYVMFSYQNLMNRRK